MADDFMSSNIRSKRILYALLTYYLLLVTNIYCASVLEDGTLLSSSTTGARYRWWRKVRRQALNDPLTRRGWEQALTWVWRAQSSKVPNKTSLSKVPKEDCRFLVPLNDT